MLKVNFIIGFLGVGKTTFIKKLIPHFMKTKKKVVLIVNDFGQENYDSIQFKDLGIEVVELTKGCLCCDLKLRFREIFLSLKDRRDIERVIIEPSGIFIPDEAVDLFKDEALRNHFLLVPFISIADIKLFQNGRALQLPCILRQIEFGSWVVLSCTENSSVDVIKKVRDQVSKINSKAKLIDIHRDDIFKIFDSEIELQVTQLDSIQPKVKSHPFFTRHIDEQLDFDNVESLNIYFRKLPANLIRAKGIIFLKGDNVFVNYANGMIETVL